MTGYIGYRYTIIECLPLVLQLVGLFLSIVNDSYINKQYRKIFLIIIVLDASILVQNYLDYALNIYNASSLIRTFNSIYGYSVRPVIIVLFYYIVGSKRRRWFSWILIIINVIIYLTALFSPISFTITESKGFVRGPLGLSCHIISGILLLHLVYLTIIEYKGVGIKEMFIPMFNALLIIVAVIMDSIVLKFIVYPFSFLTVVLISSNVFYYIWLHLQFVREHEDDLKAKQRIRIMISQIQPHFMFNTLTTIQALCSIDSKMAADTIEKFGTYLRQNIDSLNYADLIPISKEIEHTRVYTDIENIRFHNIHIEYNIHDEDFLLPALSIQPIVENSIRHGVRILDSGVVKITTRRLDDYHEIVISDNGVGFDVNTIEISSTYEAGKGDDDSVYNANDNTDVYNFHIGISNVKERIEKMCDGIFHIESAKGEGTTVVIRIPVKE